MTWTVVSGLTGSGIHTFSGSLTPVGVYTDVTADGELRELDLASPPRIQHAGWFAMVDTDPDTGVGISGDFLHQPIWLWFRKQWVQHLIQPDATTAITGFAWNLGTGVTVDFFWFS
jgi:hypothetical protein